MTDNMTWRELSALEYEQPRQAAELAATWYQEGASLFENGQPNPGGGQGPRDTYRRLGWDEAQKKAAAAQPIHPAPVEFTFEQLGTDPILRYFHYSHLPPALQAASKPFCDLARHLVETLPHNEQRTAALWRLLEAKDCAVRANVT